MEKKRRDVISLSENACVSASKNLNRYRENRTRIPHALSAFINASTLRTDKPDNESDEG
jgi:hypothetical protein